MRRRGEVIMEGIQIVELEVDRRWPPHKGKAGTVAKSPPSKESVHKFLEEYADGSITKDECKVAAEKHFDASIPQKNVWLPAWNKLSDAKKLKQGMRPKAGKSATAK